MVDVTIAPDVNLAQTNGDDGESYTLNGELTGYKFYHSDDATPLLRYRKTVDGVETWGAAVTVNVGTFNGRHATWYDRHTDGDMGNILHIVYGAATGIRYRQLNTATDVFGSEVVVISTGGAPTPNDVQIVKLRNGDLIITWDSNDAGLARGMRRSTDGGASWAAVDSLNPIGAAGDHIRLMYASNTGDNADAWFLYWDRFNDEVSIKVFDASVPSLTETLIATGMDGGGIGSRAEWGVSVRHSDGFWVLAAWSDGLVATGDLRFWTGNGAASIVEGANVLTDTASFRAAVCIDQRTDDIYVPYCTAFSGGNIAYKVSRNGGTSWEAAVTFTDATGSMGQVQGGMMILSSGGRFAPAYFDDAGGVDDWETNFDNSIPFQPIEPPGGAVGSQQRILLAA